MNILIKVMTIVALIFRPRSCEPAGTPLTELTGPDRSHRRPGG